MSVQMRNVQGAGVKYVSFVEEYGLPGAAIVYMFDPRKRK
jgi:hypothetical protein